MTSSTTEKTQRQKFIDKAKEIEADESSDSFEKSLKRITTHKPKKEEAPDK